MAETVTEQGLVGAVFTEIEAEGAARAVLEHDPEGAAREFPEPEDAGAAAEAVRWLGKLLNGQFPAIRRAMQSAELNAAQLSDDRLQGLAELIQNADDTGATAASFAVTRDASGGRVYFTHNGSALRFRDVLALATPWLSSKTNESDSLGRFGIGLMTLRALSDTIEVHCAPLHVSLGSQQVRPISPMDLPPDGRTTFVIPLRDHEFGLEDIRQWLLGWGDTGMLFLRNLARIDLIDPTSEDPEYFQLLREAKGALDLPGGEVEQHTAVARDGRRWSVFSRAEPVSPDVQRNLKAQGATTRLSVAFPVGHGDPGHLHAGLPIRPINLPFRVAAQFDPLANRRDIAETPWNLFLITAFSRLWLDAARYRFELDPASAWSCIPELSEFAQDTRTVGRLREAFESRLLVEERTEFTGTVKVRTPAGWLRLCDLGIEPEILTGVLTAEDITRLADTAGALPVDARDPGGDWRRILEDLRSTGATVPRQVEVADALELLGQEDRPVDFVAGLTAAALHENLADQLAGRPCLVLADGRRLRPGDVDGPSALVDADADQIWADLEMGRHLHDQYATVPGWQNIADWLTTTHRLVPAATSDNALARLAIAGTRDQVLPHSLSDAQANSLRAALERSTDANRTRWALNIGRAVRFDAVRYGLGGERISLKARPCEAYIIERDADSWYVAAGRTPGLIWLDRRYAKELTTSGGRSIGAQRMFKLLGAEVAPRLQTPTQLVRRLTNERQALPSGSAGEPRERAVQMRRLQAEYTLDDHVSPDLDAVLTDIANEKDSTRRRRRADAVLSTLARAWSRFDGHTHAKAVAPYYSWQPKGDLPAWWLLRAAEIPWLSSGRGSAKQPNELRRRTPGTVAVYGGEPSRYVHASHDTAAHRVVLDALEVAGDPPASELVRLLENLRKSITDPGEAADATAAVYQALEAQIRTADLRRQRLGDLSLPALRELFGRQDGLIATNLGWRRPTTVLAGPPVFGDLRPFVPATSGTQRLWELLGIRPPSTEDAKQVLRKLAKRPDLSTAEQVIMHESLKLLADKEGASLTSLHRLALWTDRGWVTTRPVYAVTDPRLTAPVSALAPVWTPGGDLRQFDALIKPFDLTVLDTSRARVVGRDRAIPDDDATEIFGRAVRNLQTDLSLNDPGAERTLALPWDQLARYQVQLLTNLRIKLEEPLLKRSELQVAAWIDPAEEMLYISEPGAAGRIAAGGYAIASLFTVGSRQIAQAWIAAWADAVDGHRAEAITLASRRAADEQARRDASRKRLTGLRTTQKTPQKSTPKATTTSGRPGGASPPPAPRPARTLVDPASLTLNESSGQLSSGAEGTETEKTRSPLKSPDLDRPKPPPASSRGPANYSPQEREDAGMELLQKIFTEIGVTLTDIRHQPNVGADAVDDRGRYYELKVHHNAVPDQVRLTDSEIQRALSTDDYYLVAIGNIEAGQGDPEVRIITDPVHQLRVEPTGTLVFSGVRSAEALVYTFGVTRSSGEPGER
ncbi:sacsin N-terminal ATP-binding-like domain-containing protein [Kribbella sp. CA-245084]|uniref:sacsin N-terminal ATP-binding-like domain-containing protein n=1 Tax=Kribbella sp. CA-245084 TaxID=3239940 RepID=UPI003D923121